MQNREKFIYIVDSFAVESGLRLVLDGFGLKEDEDYLTTDSEYASKILRPDMSASLCANKLLVFMSSFSGSVAPAIQLAKQIKAVNPRARIIFRSATERAIDSVFEMSITKGAGRIGRREADHGQLPEIIKQFLDELPPTSEQTLLTDPFNIWSMLGPSYWRAFLF